MAIIGNCVHIFITCRHDGRKNRYVCHAQYIVSQGHVLPVQDDREIEDITKSVN